MDDLISRQDAIEAINIWLYCDKDERMPDEVIKALLPVQTEIIHCKECLYRKICSWKSQGATFCSFGERGKQDDSD